MGRNGKKKYRLSEKERSFLDQYEIWSGNGVQAVLHSKYAITDYKVASVMAHRLLEKDKIQDEITRRREKAIKEFKWDYQEILKEDQAIATVDPTLAIELRQGSLTPPNELPEHVRKAISGIDVIESHAKGGKKLIKYKYRFWPKGDAIDRFTKRVGGYEIDNKQRGPGDLLDKVMDTIAGRERGGLPER